MEKIIGSFSAYVGLDTKMHMYPMNMNLSMLTVDIKINLENVLNISLGDLRTTYKKRTSPETKNGLWQNCLAVFKYFGNL